MPETAVATRRSEARPPASLHPRGSPAGSSPPRWAWTSARFAGPVCRVDRVAELGRVRHRHRRLQRRRGERPVLERRALVRRLQRQRRAGGREHPGRPRQPEADEIVERRARPQGGELVARLGGVERDARRAAVDEHEPGEVARAGAPAEVPARVGGRDRPAERVPAEDDRAAAAPRGADHPPQVLHRDAHPPPAGGRGLGVGGRREVLRHPAAEPAEVVREQRGDRRAAVPHAVEHRVVLEQVLAPLDRPDLPAGQPRDEAPGEREEVAGAGRRARREHEHVARALRADLDDADLVVPRRTGRVIAVQERQIGGARRSGAREQDQDREQDHPHAPDSYRGWRKCAST